MGSNSGPDLRVLVVLDGDTIVVTMPGTSYSVTYRKLHDSPLLVASDTRDDPDSPINKLLFERERGSQLTTKQENSAGQRDSVTQFASLGIVPTSSAAYQ